MQVVAVGNHLDQLQRHHDGQDHASNRHHDGVGKVLDHTENAAVPPLRGLAHLRGDVRDLLVHTVEHPVKFPMMPPTSISFSQLVRASNKKSIRCQTSFQPLPLCAEGTRISAGYDQTVNRPDSSGTRTMPTMATPAPAISCFMPWLFADVR